MTSFTDMTHNVGAMNAPNAATPKPGIARLTLDARWVTLYADQPGMAEDDLSVIARLADGNSVKVTGGGGVDTIARHLRRPITVWRGGAPVAMELTLLLDGYRGGQRRSVEPEIRTIEKMAGALVSSRVGGEEPFKLIVQGSGVPHDFVKSSTARWVIAEPPEFPDPVIRGRNGVRLRQGVNLKLLLWTEPDVLQRLDEGQTEPAFSFYVANGRETFNQIAQKKLKNARLGGELARLNKERNPAFKGQNPTANTKVNPGVYVRLPTKHLRDEWNRERRNRPKR